MSKSKLSLRLKALYFIEELAEGSGKSELLDKIYRIAHIARSVSCRKNHPDWIKEVQDFEIQ